MIPVTIRVRVLARTSGMSGPDPVYVSTPIDWESGTSLPRAGDSITLNSLDENWMDIYVRTTQFKTIANQPFLVRAIIWLEDLITDVDDSQEHFIAENLPGWVTDE